MKKSKRSKKVSKNVKMNRSKKCKFILRKKTTIITKRCISSYK